MKIIGKFMTFILTLIAIGLIIIIGIIGYTIYSEISGNDNVQFSFNIAEWFPIIEFNDNKAPQITLEDIDFSGVESTNNSNTNNNENRRYLYNQLDEVAKIIYGTLYVNKENLKTGIYTVEFGNTFSELLAQENGDKELQRQYQSAIEAFTYENPDIFYLNPTSMYINIETITRIFGVSYNVYINTGDEATYLAEGLYTKEDVEKREAEIEQVKNQIITQVQGKNDYEKLKIIHDYLIDNIEYGDATLGDDMYNIYGALVLKKCVCEGYAKAYQYLLNEIGIENEIVIGIGTNSEDETENHAWNYVKLNNNWYAVDVTWDDPVIRGGGKLSKKSRYQYFLKGSGTFYKNHKISNTFTSEGQEFEYPDLSLTDYK